MLITKDATSVSINVRIVDSSDGTPELGVLFNTAGIDMWYRREGAVQTSITEVTLAALTTAWTTGGFLEIGHGWYRLDVPDLAFATGVDGVQIGGTVTGMVVHAPYVQLTEADLFAALATPTNITAATGIVLSGVTHTSAVIPTVTSLTNTASADVVEWLGTAAATPTTAGVPEVDITFVGGAAVSATTAQLGVNVVDWDNTTVATPATAGYPATTVKVGTGTGELQTTSGVVDGNVAQILGNATAATNLSASTRSMQILTVNTGNVAATTTTAQFTGVTELTADHFIGRKLFWYDSTDALFLQGTSITDSSWDAGNSEIALTFQQLTDTPLDADLVVLV